MVCVAVRDAVRSDAVAVCVRPVFVDVLEPVDDRVDVPVFDAETVRVDVAVAVGVRVGVRVCVGDCDPVCDCEDDCEGVCEDVGDGVVCHPSSSTP